MSPTIPFPCFIYNNISTKGEIRNQFDILLIAVADLRKEQTDMSYQGEHQTYMI